MGDLPAAGDPVDAIGVTRSRQWPTVMHSIIGDISMRLLQLGWELTRRPESQQMKEDEGLLEAHLLASFFEVSFL